MTTPEGGRKHLHQRVEFWSARLKSQPVLVRVQPMVRKWGSCSVRGTITLADDLADQPDGFQDFVIVHELLHLRVPTHGRLFKALMTTYVPDLRRYDAMRLRCLAGRA